MLLLLLITLALRLYHLDFQSLWRDEVDALRFATRALPDLLSMFRRPGENGPLFFLALRPWLAVVGRTEFAMRFPSVLAGVAAIPITFMIARRLGDRRVAWLAALFLTTAPYAVWYSMEAKMYALLTVWVPLTLWLTLEARRHGGWWRWIGLYVTTGLGLYLHLLAALVIPVQLAWLFLARQRRARLAAALYAAALVLPYLPLVGWQAAMWLSGFRTGHPFVPLSTILTVLAVGFSRGIAPVQHPITLLPYITALVAGVGLWTTRRWRAGISLGLWLLFPPIALFGVSLRTPIFTDRYLIWTLPAFVIWLAAGCAALIGGRSWSGAPMRILGLALAGAILAFNLLAVWVQAHRPIKTDIRAAVAFVESHREPGDLLIFQIPYNRYTYRYYAGADRDPDAPFDLPDAAGPVTWIDGPYTNGRPVDDVGAELTAGTTGHRRAWLIAAEAALWDERGLTEAWLNHAGQIVDRGEFTRVVVTCYELVRPEQRNRTFLPAIQR